MRTEGCNDHSGANGGTVLRRKDGRTEGRKVGVRGRSTFRRSVFPSYNAPTMRQYLNRTISAAMMTVAMTSGKAKMLASSRGSCLRCM